MEVKADTYNSFGINGAGTWLCPSCNERVNSSEVDKHLELEIKRLSQLRTTVATTELNGENGGSQIQDDTEERKPWSIFRKVQRNRHSRLRQRARKRPQPPNEQTCPVCNVGFPLEQLQQHVDQCLRRTNGNSVNGNGGDQASDDEHDGEEYEEYEWAGQKRIRVSSLLVGGYASIGVGQTISNGGQQNDDDDDEDLNVDEDDTQIYGPAQYGESDVIDATKIETNATNKEVDVTNYMRQLITGHNPPPLPSSVHTSSTNSCHRMAADIPGTSSNSTDRKLANNEETGKTAIYYEQIIESLKTKLRQYENSAQSKLKCLICLDDYRNPAISVSCWHVHCEECWLRSLGARKLCPQCNLITTPKDLRRIFM